MQETLHTLWRAIRGGDDDDSVLKEILEELLENHGVGNVGHLRREMQMKCQWLRAFANLLFV